MKDRIEVRLTVATGKVDSKSLKSIGKVLDTKLDRIAETFTKAIEHIVNHVVEKHTKKEGENYEEE